MVTSVSLIGGLIDTAPLSHLVCHFAAITFLAYSKPFAQSAGDEEVKAFASWNKCMPTTCHEFSGVSMS